jgi:hypothetical protein
VRAAVIAAPTAHFIRDGGAPASQLVRPHRKVRMYGCNRPRCLIVAMMRTGRRLRRGGATSDHAAFATLRASASSVLT